MSQGIQESRSLILAGPPGANLMGTAYPVLRQYRVPVRLVAADPQALAMVVEANPTDRLFLMPDLFPSVEAAGSFLDNLPETMAVHVGLSLDYAWGASQSSSPRSPDALQPFASAQDAAQPFAGVQDGSQPFGYAQDGSQPRDWSGNLGAVESHPRVLAVYRQPFDWHQLARMLTDDQHSKGATLASSPEESQPQAAESAGADVQPVSIPPLDDPDGVAQQTLTEPKRPSAPDQGRQRVIMLPSCDNVLAVWSGTAGGTGKSTVATNKALQLAQAGRSVILLAFGGAARHMRLGGEGAGAFATRPDETGFREGLMPWHGLPVVSLPTDFRVAARMEEMDPHQIGSIAHLVRFAAERFELVIVDCPAGTGNWALQPLLAAGVILLVSRPTVADQTAMALALKLLDRIRKNQPCRIRLLLNDVRPGEPDVDAFRRGLGTLLGKEAPPVVCQVPSHPNVRRAQNEGLPLTSAEGLESVVARIEAIPTPWGPAEQAASRNGRGRQEPAGREINLGLLRVKVVD